MHLQPPHVCSEGYLLLYGKAAEQGSVMGGKILPILPISRRSSARWSILVTNSRRLDFERQFERMSDLYLGLAC